jgi:von Willebrand factor type A domain
MASMHKALERLPWRRRGAIPLADAQHLRLALWRTTLIRVVLGTALAVLAAVAVWRSTHLDPSPVSFLPAHSTTVVVIDQSKSISTEAYRRIATTLQRLIAADVPVGLVAFSDTSYEMIPPGARGSDLEPLLRFYTPAREGPNIDPITAYPTSPWDNIFSGGTKISSGLGLAEEMLHRDRVQRGTILLLSDLQTASDDQPTLAETLVRIERDRAIRLKVVPLVALAQDRAFFERFVPGRDIVKPSQLFVHGQAAARQSLLGRTPWTLIVVCALLLVVLGANEWFCGRLQIRRPGEAVT